MPNRLTFIVIALQCALAQNPYSTLPKNYSLDFENDYVRISRVKYSPGDKLPVHSHPSIPTVYVYLTDGGAIRFIHKTPKFTLERPPVQAGGVRFNRNAQVETHEVEYLGDSPAEYLRIEMKTSPGPPHRDARLKTGADFPWQDPQVQISRIHGTAPKPARRAILVNISDRTFTWFDPADSSAPSLPPEPRFFVIVELASDLT